MFSHMEHCLKSFPSLLTFTCICLCFAECRAGFFKAKASSDKCEPCPANTQRLSPGALSCPCMDGFYRAPTDPPTGPCSGNRPPQGWIFYTNSY